MNVLLQKYKSLTGKANIYHFSYVALEDISWIAIHNKYKNI